MAKNLIIYYSRKGENYWNGGFKDLKRETLRSWRNTFKKR